MLDPKIARRIAPTLLGDVVAYFEAHGRPAPFTLSPWDVARALDLYQRSGRYSTSSGRQEAWTAAQRLMILMAQNPGSDYLATAVRAPFGLRVERRPPTPARPTLLAASAAIIPDLESA